MTTALLFLALLGLLALAIVAGLVVHHITDGGPRPLWRWWVFCAALDFHFRFRTGSNIQRTAGRVMSWCVLPEWVGHDGGTEANDDAEVW